MVLGSCKTRNRYINRKFHDTNARFNGYFNAKESIKEGELALKNAYQENWDEILPIFIYPTEESAASVYPQMDRAIEKCTKVIDRHSIVEKRKEYNKWIDDCWLLIGVANFYRRDFGKSEEMFKYVTKSFKTDPNKYHAALWNARGYIQQEEYTKAGAILEKLEEDQASFPEKFMPTFYEVYCDYFVRQEEWKDAIEKMELAINHEDQKKKRKTRLTFILAQLYQADNDSQRAIRNYVAVTRMNPSYEMEFYARINQALAFDSKLDSGTIREQLNKLLRDDKYNEFHDQIYYALAEVEFTDRNYAEGIEYLLTSAAVSEGNDKQKGKSFLRLADYYFDQRKYEVASTYFDSTVTYLPRDYPNYEIIKNKKESLTDLVTNIEIILTEDSLQALAGLDESERNKIIEGLIDKLEEEEEKRIAEEEAKRAEQLAQLNPEENRKNKSGNKGGAWYFYNASAKSAGYAEFQRIYGKRSLEDNWRRKDKQSFANFDPSNPEESIAESSSASNVPSSEELLKDVPLDDEALEASHEKIRKAFYDMGTIYKEKLEDIDNAIETFEELGARYPEHEIAATSYYQLYRLFLQKEQSGNYFSSDSRSSSAFYRELLINEFPESEYAKLILDPDYQTNRDLEREAILEAYEDTYRQYRRRNYNEVLLVTLDVINNDQQNELLPKYHLLRAMSIAGKKDKPNYIKTLKDIVRLYPGTEEQAEAKRLLGLLNDGSMSLEEESSNNELENEREEEAADNADDEENDIWNDDPETAGDEEEVAEEVSPFKVKEDIDHFFIAVIPNKGADLNKLKRDVSDFHQENFRNEDLKITTSFLNKDSQIILVRKFQNKEVGMNYYNVFSNNSENLSEINEGDYPFFIISSSNFATLFKLKDVEQYLEFFSANYL